MVMRMRRIKKKIILFIINHFLSGTHAFAIKRYFLNAVDNVKIGKNTKVVGPIYIYGALSVGEDTWIGHDFRTEGNGAVSIGNRCDIAPMVTCFTGGHKIGDHNRRAGEGVTESISIGNGCWIGGGASLIYGTIVSDGVVVAAGAVVTKSVDADCLVGGIPAKTIRQL